MQPSTIFFCGIRKLENLHIDPKIIFDTIVQSFRCNAKRQIISQTWDFVARAR